MVSFLAGRLRGNSVACLLPCYHGLADMDTAVIDDIGPDDLMTVLLQQPGHRPSQKDIADMSQMQRLVGIRRGIFHHNCLAGGRQTAEILVRRYGGIYLLPERRGELYIQKALDHIEAFHFGDIGLKPLPYLLSSGLGSLAAGLQQRKDHQCDIALKLLPGSLKLQGHINARSPV